MTEKKFNDRPELQQKGGGINDPRKAQRPY